MTTRKNFIVSFYLIFLIDQFDFYKLRKKVIYENKVLKFTLCLIRLHLSCILFIYFLILGHMLCSKDFKIQNL